MWGGRRIRQANCSYRDDKGGQALRFHAELTCHSASHPTHPSGQIQVPCRQEEAHAGQWNALKAWPSSIPADPLCILVHEICIGPNARGDVFSKQILQIFIASHGSPHVVSIHPRGWLGRDNAPNSRVTFGPSEHCLNARNALIGLGQFHVTAGGVDKEIVLCWRAFG